MSKDTERINFRVDAELKDQLDAKENLNTSGLMRSLLESYLLVGDTIEVGLERRLKDAEQELERKRLEKVRLEGEIEKVEREIDKLEQRIEERRQQTPEEVIEFAEKVKSEALSPDQLVADNPAVTNWAQKAGIPPDEFTRLVEERL